MCYKLPYGELKFDHNLSKHTTEYILNLDPFGQHLFAFVLHIHYPKKFNHRDFEFPIYVIRLFHYLINIKLKN